MSHADHKNYSFYPIVHRTLLLLFLFALDFLAFQYGDQAYGEGKEKMQRQ